jgi:hypothetical protein
VTFVGDARLDVLKSLDVLIGLTVVLLALSMAVTVIIQSITTLVNSRGRHLRRGLTDLLQQLDPALTESLSQTVATRILMHPLVSGSHTPVPQAGSRSRSAALLAWVRRATGGPRLGSIVHREEFTKLVMGLACGQGTVQLDAVSRAALSQALANNGVADPDATLKTIRTLALQLERSSPELSNMARQNIAILHAAESDLVAKINNWFDQTMDRTSQRFTASTRAITFFAAFIVAFGLQVDTPSLVNRLAADDSLRAAFVAEGRALYADQQAEEKRRAAEKAPPPAGETPGGEAGAAAATAPSVQPSPADPDEMARKYRAFLATNGIVRLPSSAGWWEGFRTANIFGMLLTALLLSMGAPFWYSTLGRLLQLRSVLASKDDAQRRERQSSEVAPAGQAAAVRSPALPAVGERGDLTAIG